MPEQRAMSAEEYCSLAAGAVMGTTLEAMRAAGRIQDDFAAERYELLLIEAAGLAAQGKRLDVPNWAI